MLILCYFSVGYSTVAINYVVEPHQKKQVSQCCIPAERLLQLWSFIQKLYFNFYLLQQIPKPLSVSELCEKLPIVQVISLF